MNCKIEPRTTQDFQEAGGSGMCFGLGFFVWAWVFLFGLGFCWFVVCFFSFLTGPFQAEGK